MQDGEEDPAIVPLACPECTTRARAQVSQLKLAWRTRLWGRWARWRAVESHLASTCRHDGMHLACLGCRFAVAFGLEFAMPGVFLAESHAEERG